mmetsp:Transcript_25506/g.75141  ORF Transcript_25506/g.75141 Transcript_25506/m.75141 type:complete len:219 (-) Transcript_25506:300-956(-)
MVESFRCPTSSSSPWEEETFALLADADADADADVNSDSARDFGGVGSVSTDDIPFFRRGGPAFSFCDSPSRRSAADLSEGADADADADATADSSEGFVPAARLRGSRRRVPFPPPPPPSLSSSSSLSLLLLSLLSRRSMKMGVESFVFVFVVFFFSESCLCASSLFVFAGVVLGALSPSFDRPFSRLDLRSGDCRRLSSSSLRSGKTVDEEAEEDEED